MDTFIDIDGEEFDKVPGDLATRMFHELVIGRVDGKSLTCLRSDERCFLMFMESWEGPSFISLSQEEQEGELRFELSNGEVDTYPAELTVPLATAVEAIRTFHASGERSGQVHW